VKGAPHAAGGVRDYLGLVRFSHTIFALPFALQGAWLAARGRPAWGTLALIVVACVAARTAAMAFNRLVDARLDADNPRTSGRELPAGRLSPRAVAVLVAVSCATFVALAFALNPLCGKLSFCVLAILLAYSFAKRVTWLCHALLGLSLGLAPLGAWLAVRGELDQDVWVALILAAAVLTWVAGFDLIYACQDADHDARVGLHSIPARFGIAKALGLSSALHALTVALLALLAREAELGWIFVLALVACALLLAWEHRLVSPGDLSRVNAAFFTVNGWVAVALFAGCALDLAFLSGTRA
jgi:4-hydroxybenzoate polyprenyltransferase